MIRDGPIPAFVHGMWEYVGGLLLIALPLALSYDSGAATAASIILGLLVIFLAASSSGRTSLINEIPLAAHVLLDYLLVAALIASPFAFGFSDEKAPTIVFIAAGILHMLVSIGTRYRKRDDHDRRRRRHRERHPTAGEPTELERSGRTREPAVESAASERERRPGTPG